MCVCSTVARSPSVQRETHKGTHDPYILRGEITVAQVSLNTTASIRAGRTTHMSWVTLRLRITVSQSVSLASSPSATLDQVLGEVRQLCGLCHWASSLTEGRVCLLYLTLWSLLYSNLCWSLLYRNLYLNLLAWFSLSLRYSQSVSQSVTRPDRPP
jgi:hypothetical protein